LEIDRYIWKVKMNLREAPALKDGADRPARDFQGGRGLEPLKPLRKADLGDRQVSKKVEMICLEDSGLKNEADLT
jgi:hypothetical protein